MTKILIVDDAMDAADSLMQLCVALGHETYVALNGAAAIALAVREVPHIILMDLNMPGMDGFETAAGIRSTPGTDDPFIIALTGLTEMGIELRTKAAGFDFHLTKPAPISFLLALIDNLAGRERPSRRL